MILVNNVLLPLSVDFSDLKTAVSDTLKIKGIKTAKLYKKSVDARKKDNIKFCCSVLLTCENEAAVLKENKNATVFSNKKYEWQKADKNSAMRPIVVGFGPAGMFAALTLARAGLKPIILERGSAVEKRISDVESFFGGGKLNTESNVQFGEGGAGTFSDGKLNTGIKNPRCRAVLDCFNEFGAPDKILYDAKPHIGTDILVNVVKGIRNEILSLGGEILFDTKLESINAQSGKITSVIANGTKIVCDTVIIATGHSARDTFCMLYEIGVEMIKKPFSVGVRIEHLQSDINKALYGKYWDSPYLSAADYKMAVHLENGRGVYTFCMCPGGEVINASSEAGGIAVNGMSKSKRDGKNANSALLVGIDPDDLKGDLFEGIELQRKIESRAYNLANGSVPITTVGNFVFSKEQKIGKVKPTVKPDFTFADFTDIFPDFVTDSLRQGIIAFDKKIEGFADCDAILTAPETRSSSPLRIVRAEDYQSITLKGLYPCGEGAGYAGGIMSAAVDGMTVAEQIISVYKN